MRIESMAYDWAASHVGSRAVGGGTVRPGLLVTRAFVGRRWRRRTVGIVVGALDRDVVVARGWD